MFHQDLIRKCQANNSKAQEELFERYKGLVISICRRYSKDQLQAEDLLQETFIKVFRHLKKSKSIEIQDVKSWISRIAINTTISQYKKDQKFEYAEYPEMLDDKEESHH